jgi:hypothetical protein
MSQPFLTVNSLGDLGQTTLPELNRLKITEIATDLQKYLVMSPDGILNKEGVETVESGKSFQWDVMVNDSGSAANVGMGYQDHVSIVDTTVQATADWRNSKTDFAVIAQETQMNASPAKIVDLKMLREKAAMISLVVLMENNFFGPPPAITDTLTPWGLRTWITKNASEGFNGAAPSGYTTIGLNPTTYPRWKNWTAQYTTVDDTDFVRKLNKAVEFVDWKPPIDGLPLLKTGSRYRYFSNYGLIGPLQELLKASNDQLGMDITKYANAVVINRIPLVRVPLLEADTTNPIYGVCMSSVKLYRLKNFWMRRTSIANLPGHHMVNAEYLDSTYQTVFTNRRDSFVLATGTTEPG